MNPDDNRPEGMSRMRYIMTPQELALMDAPLDSEYTKRRNWLVPLAVQDGEDKRMVDAERRKKYKFNSFNSYWKNANGNEPCGLVKVRYPGLDPETGKTDGKFYPLDENLKINWKFRKKFFKNKFFWGILESLGNLINSDSFYRQ